MAALQWQGGGARQAATQRIQSEEGGDRRQAAERQAGGTPAPLKLNNARHLPHEKIFSKRVDPQG